MVYEYFVVALRYFSLGLKLRVTNFIDCEILDIRKAEFQNDGNIESDNNLTI